METTKINIPDKVTSGAVVVKIDGKQIDLQTTI